MIEAMIFDLDGTLVQTEKLKALSYAKAAVHLRLRLYDEILAGPDVIRQNQWPHNMVLLQAARRNCPYVGLATIQPLSRANVYSRAASWRIAGLWTIRLHCLLWCNRSLTA